MPPPDFRQVESKKTPDEPRPIERRDNLALIFDSAFDSSQESRTQLIERAKSTDVFELQSGRQFNEMALMFLHEGPPRSFTVDFKEAGRTIEMSIGLAHIFPPSVVKVAVTDTAGQRREGFRSMQNGRLGYFDEHGYIPVFTGYKVEVLGVLDKGSADATRQDASEREYWEKLKKENETIAEQEREHMQANDGFIRLDSLLRDKSGRFTAEQNDFNKIQEEFGAAGLSWDERTWMTGGAVLRRLNGRGIYMLQEKGVMDIFKTLASKGYRANLDDIQTVSWLAAAFESDASLRRDFDSHADPYEFLRAARRLQNQTEGGIEVGTEANIAAVNEANAYLSQVLQISDRAGREIYENSLRTCGQLDNRALEAAAETFRPNIERLNSFGWANDSYAMFLTGQHQVLYLLYKNNDGKISFGTTFRVSMGRRDRMGSNESGSNGTPKGMMEWFLPEGSFNNVDSLPIGANIKKTHKDRGEGGTTSRYMRTRGIEASNSNNVSRGILFHGGGYMDDYRGGYEQTWVPRSRGCIVTSNADTMRIWSFVRRNVMSGQKVLCDVIA